MQKYCLLCLFALLLGSCASPERSAERSAERDRKSIEKHERQRMAAEDFF